MPASTSAIMKNVDRMRNDAKLIALWNAAAADDRSPGQAWSEFIKAADSARIADRIPGSVGRAFKAKYGAGPTPTTPATSRKRPASSSTKAAGSAAKRTTGKAAK